MKRIIAILVVLTFMGCKGQEKEKKDVSKEEKQEKPQEPNGQWEVHREYDEAGNLIKYDSIYSYSYSNKNGDSVKINLDSIM
ncbi:MAG: hypothetical protein KJO63_10370, partial [Maribacter sp.]|nr:hypothetical protein [Maribacter sp.]